MWEVSEEEYRKSKSYTVYLDPHRNFYCAGIYGIKYGKLDTLTVVHKDNDLIVAESREGHLEIVGDRRIYKNKLLGISVVLKEVDYTENIDYQRLKLFEINAFNQISLLKGINHIDENEYRIDWNISNDYFFIAIV